MTKVEMECCKKMAGECHMDPRSHPCCEKTASRASAVAILQQLYLLHPNFAVATLDVQPDELIAQAFEADRLTLGLPPPGPPDLNSPLRI